MATQCVSRSERRERHCNGDWHRRPQRRRVADRLQDRRTSSTASSRPCATSHIPIKKGTITAFIGPSGCGKSTALRCLNRMNDLVRGFRFKGHVHFRGQDIYHPRDRPGRRAPLHRHGLPAAEPVRDEHLSQRRVRAAPERRTRRRRRKVEQALRSAALWDEVKDKLQHERSVALRRPAAAALHRARRSPPSPRSLLMDEPCSALDPIATRQIEELMLELKKRFTIAIVTHNLQQAKRVADKTAFLYVDTAAAAGPATSSSTATRGRSSRTRRSSAPRSTSAASSAESVTVPRVEARREPR